jgi:Uma2 family endonuclease
MMPTLAKWSVADYHKMVAAGILAGRSVELIAGEIVEMAPEGPLHRFINVTAADYLRKLLQGKARIYEAHPVTLIDSEPEPDIAVVRLPDTRYLSRHPGANDIYWLIEIADSTLAGDLGKKKKAYAGAGLQEYWVLDVQAGTVKVFRQPVAENYCSEAIYSEGVISPVAFPEIQVAIAKLFGK